MNFKLIFSNKAAERYTQLKSDPSMKRILKDIQKTLAYMETNLRHPSLNTHEYYSLKGPNGEKIFESYAQQYTPGAYRIFWLYGPSKAELTIIAMVPHP